MKTWTQRSDRWSRRAEGGELAEGDLNTAADTAGGWANPARKPVHTRRRSSRHDVEILRGQPPRLLPSSPTVRINRGIGGVPGNQAGGGAIGPLELGPYWLTRAPRLIGFGTPWSCPPIDEQGS